jgi:hypothetical protein
LATPSQQNWICDMHEVTNADFALTLKGASGCYKEELEEEE